MFYKAFASTTLSTSLSQSGMTLQINLNEMPGDAQHNESTAIWFSLPPSLSFIRFPFDTGPPSLSFIRFSFDTGPLRAPKWYKRPAAASFGFGGKIVSFHPSSSGAGSSEVYVHSLVTEQSLVDRSSEFESAIHKADHHPDPNNVDEAVEKLRKQGIEAIRIVCHVSNEQQRKNLIEKTVQFLTCWDGVLRICLCIAGESSHRNC